MPFAAMAKQNLSWFCNVFRRLHGVRGTNQCGWVFDIDGVLQRGKTVLSAGLGAIRELHDADSGRWRAPVVFMTNSGGTSEAQRAQILSSALDVPVCASQVVLSHSPMKYFAPQLSRSDRCVVTVGGPLCPAVARSYGFENVIDVAQLGQAQPHSTPFASYDHLHDLPDDARDIAKLPVSTVLVMADSKDFHRDLQLIVDIVEENEQQRSEPATIVFANSDLTFPNEHSKPRLAGGMFRVALDAILKVHNSGSPVDYNAIQLGKPHAPNYTLAEESLCRQLHQLKSRPGAWDGKAKVGNVFDRVYMVGDNPKSDIRGARLRGHPWHSILVRSGNFRGDNDTEDPADLVVENAHEAVAKTKSWQ